MTGILHICSCMEGMSFLNECQPLYIEKFSACAVAGHWISNRTGDARFRFRCGKRGLISGIVPFPGKMLPREIQTLNGEIVCKILNMSDRD